MDVSACMCVRVCVYCILFNFSSIVRKFSLSNYITVISFYFLFKSNICRRRWRQSGNSTKNGQITPHTYSWFCKILNCHQYYFWGYYPCVYMCDGGRGYVNVTITTTNTIILNIIFVFVVAMWVWFYHYITTTLYHYYHHHHHHHHRHPKGLSSEEKLHGVKYIIESFVGCIRNVVLSSGKAASDLLPITPLVATKHENVNEGCSNKCHSRRNLCFVGSRCINHFYGISCDCFGTHYEGEHCDIYSKCYNQLTYI